MKKIIILCFFAFWGVLDISFAQTLANGPWPIRGQNLQHTGKAASVYSASDSLKWRYTTNSSITSSPVVGSDGTVYFGSYDNYLYAINADGTLKWSYLTGGVIWSSPTIASDGTIYVGSGDNYLYAIKSDGTLKWKYLTENWVYSSPAIGTDGTVYFGSYDAYIYALNVNGTLKWKYQTSNSIYSSPAIGADGVIYVGSGDNSIYALYPSNGSLKWRYQTNGWVYSSPSIGPDGTIYAGSGDNYLYAITSAGTLKWKYQTGNSIISSPAISASDSTVYIGSYDNYLYAVKTDGTLKWKYQTGNSIYCSPLIGADGTVYFGSLDKYLYAVTSNGALKWKHITGGYIHYSSPAMATDGTLYAGSYDNNLYAFYPDTPTITITSPNGGESWIAGKSKKITWNSVNVPTVKIEYSIDNGFNWITIIASTSGTSGSYSWTVPNNPSTSCRIRISDTSNALVNSISNSLFTILELPYITLISPNGGEVLVAYTHHIIAWQSASITNVKIDFFNGTSWSTVVQNAPSTGQYSWSVPVVSSSNCRIKITDTSDSLMSDVSNTVFSVAISSIAILSPNGKEHWIAGSSQNILWTSSHVDNVKIDFSSDNGSTWSPIVLSTPSTGSYSWTIPNVTSKYCLIRIMSTAISQTTVTSKSPFYISPQPEVSVITPTGGEIWTTGATKSITWTSSYVDSVKIDYSINNGASWITIVSPLSSLTGTYNWTVPGTVSTNCLVRVTDITNVQIYDTSNAVFTISLPTLTLLYPNGGANWIAGLTNNITWTSFGVANVKIEYSTNNGTAWTTITASTSASSGSFAWVIPNVASTNCLVRITDVSNSLITDVSDFVFTISYPPSVTVVSPNGGESWMAGTSKNITWTSISAGNLKIEYSINNGTSWITIATNLSSASGSYTWTVPNTTSANCLIKITDIINTVLTDRSNSVFTITPPPSITVTSPNGGENWITGTTHNITWTSFNVGNVKLEYSLDNGATFTLITASVPSGGAYSWITPNLASETCLIKITDTTNPAVTDKSNAVFVISMQPSITVTSPNGGETWVGGSSSEITWTSVNVTDVSIDFSIDNGVTFQTVVTSTPSTGSYIWTIPNLPSTKCLIKISDKTNSTINDKSNEVFTVSQTPYITVLSPNGGEKWTAGTSHEIKWTAVSVTNIKIEYTEDNGINYLLIASDVSASSGVYQWIVPGDISTTSRIKISNSSDTTVNDFSDGVFTILPPPSLKVISPSGGEKWIAGSLNFIRWNLDNVQKVKIEYSLNNGGLWSTIASDIDGSIKQYSWTLPDTVSSDCLIRITDISNSAVYDLSESRFSIGKLTPPLNFAASDIPENNQHRINLSWSLSFSESFIDGYRIYRSRIPDFKEPPIDINTIGSVEELIEKEQTSTILVAVLQHGVNTYLDDYVIRSGVDYYYWIDSFSGENSSDRVQANKVTNVESSVQGFDVYGAFPNPFNPATTISYSIPEPENVKIVVYNASGQEMTVIFEGHTGAGKHEVVFNAAGLSSGVYFYHFVAGAFSKTGKMLLMK